MDRRGQRSDPLESAAHGGFESSRQRAGSVEPGAQCRQRKSYRDWPLCGRTAGPGKAYYPVALSRAGEGQVCIAWQALSHGGRRNPQSGKGAGIDTDTESRTTRSLDRQLMITQMLDLKSHPALAFPPEEWKLAAARERHARIRRRLVEDTREIDLVRA